MTAWPPGAEGIGAEPARPGEYAGGGADGGGPGGGAVGPGDAAAGGWGRVTSGAPQATQKRLAGSFIAPQRWQVLMDIKALDLGVRSSAVYSRPGAEPKRATAVGLGVVRPAHATARLTVFFVAQPGGLAFEVSKEEEARLTYDAARFDLDLFEAGR